MSTTTLTAPPRDLIRLRDLPARRWALCLGLLALATILLRAYYFGNPMVDVDEEFYLLVGDRMLHGAIPYVDIWDRKPIGLFLIYAAIRLLGGDGVLQYQLVAAICAAATAILIATAARRITTPGAALVAGLAYVPALAVSGGAGGQAPVFYNLPMMLAVLLVLDVVAPRPVPVGAARLRARGMAAMLLVGVAMQIKYSAVFEGVYLGLALLWTSRHTTRHTAHTGARVIDAALWIGCALLPTALAWGWYIAIGHGDAFIFANFTSILKRSHEIHALKNLRQDIGRIAPFLVTIVIGEWLLRPWIARHDTAGRAHRFVMGWLAAALLGFVLFGAYYRHYVLPLLPPLAIASAPVFAVRWRRAGMVLATLVLLIQLVSGAIDAHKRTRKRGGASYGYQLADVIRPRLYGRCLYVFYGEPILYHLTQSCLPTRWVFPFHLSLAREAPALGIDPLAETRRILATRPSVIVDQITNDDQVNPAVQALVRADLARNYRLVFARRQKGKKANVDLVYERR